MCEVAIMEFNKVLEMDADTSIPEEHFPAPVTLAEFKKQVIESGLTEYVKGDVDWLLCAILNIKKEDLTKPDVKIPYGWTLRLEKMKER